MASSITDEFLLERIEKTKLLIVAYEDAMSALAGGAQTYTLDTGQTKVMKQVADLGSMRITLDHLYNLLATLDTRLNGGATHVIPGF